MEKVIAIEKITENEGKEILKLIPLIYKEEGKNIYTGISCEHGELSIGILVEERDKWRVCLCIRESGEIYLEDTRYEKVVPINIIPLIDYLRAKKIILS